MAEGSMREGVREVAQQARPSEINPKLEEAVQNQPLLPHLLSFKVVLGAVGIGVLVALILLLLASPMMAGIGLMIAFFGAWFGLATLSYGRESEQRSAESSDDADGDDAKGDDAKGDG
jgi:Flp pilus assembly protein TadB